MSANAQLDQQQNKSLKQIELTENEMMTSNKVRVRDRVAKEVEEVEEESAACRPHRQK